MTTNNPCSEAPASWNTRYITPEGFECQITLRADTGQEVLEKAQGAIVFLLKSGCAPCWNGKHSNHEQPQYTDPVTVPDGNGNNGHERNWCAIHQPLAVIGLFADIEGSADLPHCLYLAEKHLHFS